MGSESKKYIEIIDEQIGVFYDNPDQLENEALARAIYGIVIPEEKLTVD